MADRDIRTASARRSERNRAIRSSILQHGRDILSSPNFRSTRAYIQHGTVSVHMHSISVASISLAIMKKLECLGIKSRERDLVRGALLHDYFLYDWHHHRHPKGLKNLHGFRHPQTALKNAEKEYVLTPRQRDIIGKHMWPLTMTPPACREAWIVTVADKYCSLLETLRLRRGAGKARRHGARRGKGTEGRR